MASSYVLYNPGTKVRIISTGETGKAYESAFGIVSVYIEGLDYVQFYPIDDVEFL